MITFSILLVIVGLNGTKEVARMKNESRATNLTEAERRLGYIYDLGGKLLC